MKKYKFWKNSALYPGILLVLFVCILVYAKEQAPMLEENISESTPVPTEGASDGNIWTDQNESIEVTPPIVQEGQQTIFQNVWDNIQGTEIKESIKEKSNRTIIIKKSGSGYENVAVQIEELPVYRQLRLVITGITGTTGITDNQILRIAEDTLCQGMPPTPTPAPEPTQMIETDVTLTAPTKAEPISPMPLSPTPTPTLSPDDPLYPWRFDPVKAIEITTEQQEDGSFASTVLLTLDKTYYCQLSQDEYNYYICLGRPKEVYEKIIVIDAGHGGLDAGTCSDKSVYLEKAINLNIVLYLKELLDAQKEIKVYYTRTADFKPSLSQRVALANDVEADFFLSVHCNASESKALNGTEVLYSAAQNDWEGMNSKKFAQICLDKMNQYLGLKNRGLVPRDHNVTIIKDAQVPVALVEVAFMTNASDMAVLAEPETQQNIARALYNAILEGYSILDAEKETIEAETIDTKATVTPEITTEAAAPKTGDV